MKEVFEKIKKRIEEKREYYYLNDDVFDTIAVEALDFACDVIDEEVKNCNDGWIPCEIELPKEKGYYLTTWKSGNERRGLYGNPMVEVLYFKGKQWSVQQMAHRRVIAWQPLPQPYVKGE